MGWRIKIGQGASIRTQGRVIDVVVTEEFAHQEFVVTIKNPSATDRAQARGRVDAAIIEIKRGSDTLIEGFIEDIEKEGNTIKYIGRSFLVLTGYTTSSLTDGSSGVTEAEYDDETGATIIDDLLATFCYVNDNELVYTDLTFTEVYGGEVKLHGKKVYDIIRNMCIDYTKDLWADATWTGDDVTAKNIHVGSKSRGSVGAPNKTLYGGIHLKNIPTVKYRSSQNVINRIRVNGKGTGKDKVSVVVNDATSQTTYGVIEGAPYNNNMIVDEATAEAVGDAIIAAKKDLVEEIHVDLIQYLSDLKYGDWVRIVDAYSFVDTTQRIKKITRSYNDQQGEAVAIEVGMPFDNYETLIKDLTKGDVDAEPEMTKLGGAFTITANDPASDYVRHDKGDWYDTTGTFQTHGKGVCAFWTYADNPATGQYKKALIQISNAGVVSYKVGSQETTAGAAEGITVSADALNTPIGEVILKGKAVGGGGYTVEDVYSSDESGKSYIYRDVRPIVGSSSAGYGGLWEVSGIYIRPLSGKPVTMEGEEITKLPEIWGPLNSDFSLHGSNAADNAWVEFIKWDHETETIVIPDKKITGLATATNPSDAARFDQIGAAGLWEVDGLESQLTVARDIDMRSKVLKNLAAGAVNGDSIRYDEYSVHTHDGRYYTETEIGTWRNSVTQTEMGYVHGITSDIQTQLDARMLLSVYDPGSDGVVISTAGGTGQSSYAKGDILYASNTNVLSKLAHGTENQVLTMDATLVPVWSSAGAAGLWEVSGIYAQLIAAKAIDMQTNDIINCTQIAGETTGTEGADKLIIDFRGDTNHQITYVGITDNRLLYKTTYAHAFGISTATITEIDANGLVMNTGKTIKAYSGDLTIGSNMSLGGSYKIKSLAAATVNGDAVRYNEFHAHDIATTGVHGAGANTIEHTGHKGAASGYCGLDADGYIPSVGILAPLTKGNLMVGSATVVTALGVGTNTHVLTLDSTEALGMKWAAAGTAGLWEDKGSYVQLIVADDVDFRAKNILHLASLRSNFAAGMTIFDSNGATKAYLGPTGYAFKANADIDMATSWKLKNLAAGAVAGDSIRYDEYSVHTHDSRYYTETETNTWRNSTTQTEMGYVHGVTSDIQTQLNGKLSLGGGTMNSEAGINMNDGSLTNVGGLSMTNLETIDMNGGDIIDIDDLSFAGSSSLIDMNGGDIIDVDQLKGTSGVPLKIEFKGDTTHRIYIDSTTPYYARYQTVTAHEFDIGAAAICYVSSVGITMAAGKYIKSSSGDLELRAPSGSKIKFVIG